MSESRTTIVERLYDAANRSAEEGTEVEEMVAGIVDLLDAEIEWVNPPEAIEGGTRRGIEGFTEAMRNARKGLGLYRYEVGRMVERGERVAATTRFHIEAPGSGVSMTSTSHSHLWTFRGDRVVRIEWFLDPEQAFKRLDEES
jgi:ketosteroid isomerase-like protein